MLRRLAIFLTAVVTGLTGAIFAATPAHAAAPFWALTCNSWGVSIHFWADTARSVHVGQIEWAWNKKASDGYYRLTVVDDSPRDGYGYQVNVDAGTASQANVIPYSNVYHYNIYYAVRKWRPMVLGGTTWAWKPPTSCS